MCTNPEVRTGSVIGNSNLVFYIMDLHLYVKMYLKNVCNFKAKDASLNHIDPAKVFLMIGSLFK